jgi:hypothetical protein
MEDLESKVRRMPMYQLAGLIKKWDIFHKEGKADFSTSIQIGLRHCSDSALEDVGLRKEALANSYGKA